jgi:outer membrane lipoprotein carrier protein
VSRYWLCLTLFSVCAYGANSPLDALFKGVENRYNKAQSLQVFFHESYSAPQRPKRTESGSLRLRKPGRMRMDYTDPAGKLFLSDGKLVYLYTPATKEVEKFKMRESEDMRIPLAFLLGKLNFDKEFQDFQSRQEGDLTWLTGKPKSENLPYAKVEFAINPSFQIRRVVVTGYDRTVLDFAFDEEKLNPPIDAKVFRFQLPAGAKLIEEAQ